ncbi:MAG: extracellular solute-binding protein [Candidatus Komeilibacteria bacterium]|nr:extracellular solute-binding protein [Candidatus Komeilibacteria bacterium]
MTLRKKIILGALLLSLPLFGFGCKSSQTGDVKELTKPIDIQWWGVWEDSDQVQSLIDAYKQVHPNVTISYRKFRYEEYETELTKAWLEKRGPEIFSVPANFIRKYENLIIPMPEKMKLPYIELRGTFKKEPVTVVKDVSGLTGNKVRELFIDAVSEQVIINDKVYGLPLYADNLVLFYNRDLLNSAKIPLPASTWEELVEQVPQLTTFDNEQKIKQAAIALGTDSNVPRASDILALLMMQNGAPMINGSGYATFNSKPEDSSFHPAENAVSFYTSFVNSGKATYTWEDQLPDALDMFTSGRLAYFIGYSYQIPIIQARAPKLNFNIAPMIQTAIDERQHVNYADFWALSTYFGAAEDKIAPAWSFIKYISTTPEVVKPFLEEIDRPTALRSLINDQVEDEKVGIFAKQLLNSRNWYRGYKPEETETIMRDLIYQARHNIGKDFTLIDLLNLTVAKINRTISKPQ